VERQCLNKEWADKDSNLHAKVLWKKAKNHGSSAFVTLLDYYYRHSCRLEFIKELIASFKNEVLPKLDAFSSKGDLIRIKEKDVKIS
jgi:hypothetical protein